MRRPSVAHHLDFFPEKSLFHGAREHVVFSHRQASFGLDFPHGERETEWPRWLAPLRQKVEKCLQHPVTNCLAVWLTRPQWHWESYDMVAPRSRIALATVPGPHTLRLRLASNHERLIEHHIPAGALLTMDAKTQEHWQYAVVPRGEADSWYCFSFRYLLTNRG